VNQDLEKFFCNHCGNQLLLRHGADGLLIAQRVKELQASTNLKEMQTILVAMDAVKSQIAQIEAKGKELRTVFLRLYRDSLAKDMGQKLYKAINKYLAEARGYPEYTQKTVWSIPREIYTEQYRGMETIEDFYLLYTYFSQMRPNAIQAQILQTLVPVLSLWQQLMGKKAELEHLQEEVLARQK